MEKSNDVVSLIVPCLNGEAYLLRCLKSIERQTYGINNLDIILIDDGSSDSTLDIMNQYMKRYPTNIKVICLKENKGLSYARNCGMEYAYGEFVMFVDADDCIDATMIEKMHDKIVEYHCDEVQCGVQKFSVESQCISSKGNKDRFYDLSKKEDRIFHLFSTWIPVWAKLYRKSYLDRNRIRFVDGLVYEDNHFTLLNCCLMKTSYYLDEKLYFYFQNQNGLSISTKNISKLRDHMRACDLVVKELKERGMYDSIMNEMGMELEAQLIWHSYFEPMNQLQVIMNMESKYYEEEIVKKYPNILKNTYLQDIPNPAIKKFLDVLK